MTTYPSLTCSLRATTGSNAMRTLRKHGLIPATVYGHGDSQSLTLDLRHYLTVEHQSQSNSQIVHMTLDGTDGGLALVKAVQRDAIKNTPVHIDLQRISLEEDIQVSVQISLVGEPIGVQEGGALEFTLHTLNLRCAAGIVPEQLTFDMSAMHAGDTLLAGQIVLPEGCELLDRPEECIAVIHKVATEAKAEPTTVEG